MPRCAVLAVVALMLPGLARAANVPTLAAGIQLYEAGDFGKAQASLASLAADAAASDTDRLQATIYLGASQFALGDKQSATKTFASLARQHPAVRLDPAVFPPELLAFAERVRTQELKAPAASRPPAAAPSPEAAREVVEPPPSTGLRSRAWIPAVAGVAFAGVGAALFAVSHSTADQILSSEPSIKTFPELNAAITAGRNQQTAGVVLLATGGVALAAAGAMFAFGGPSTPAQVTVMVAPGSAGVSLGGSLP